MSTAFRFGRSAAPASGAAFLRQMLSTVWLGLAWAGMLFVICLGLSLAFDDERTINITQAVVATVSIVLAAGWWVFLAPIGLISRTRADAASAARLEEVRRKARENIAKFAQDLESNPSRET